MSSKSKAFTLHSSSSLSNIFKRSVPAVERNVTNKLEKARQKLLAVINDVMKSAKETGPRKPDPSNDSYFLTLEQYKDAVFASRTLKEVDVLLKSNRKYLSKNFKTNFDLENAKVKVNKYGKIYVDTAIMVQLMDLHDVIGKITKHVQEMPMEGYTDMLSTETEVSFDSTIDADRKLTDLLAELDSNPGSRDSKGHSMSTKEILTALSLPLRNKFIVMPADMNELPPLTEEQISDSREDVEDTRKTKSTSSLKHNEVTDAAGARRIIIRCLSDLDKVKHYLYTVDQTYQSEDEDDRVPDTNEGGESTDEEPEPEIVQRDPSQGMAREPSHGVMREPSQAMTREPSQAMTRERSHSLRREPSHDVKMTESERKKCCCAEDCPGDQPLEFTWKEGDETSSKLVICIKGKSEEEGDIHVVIRQCPECKLLGQTDEMHHVGPLREPSLAKQPSSLVREPSHLAKEPSRLAREPSHLAKEPSRLAKEPSRLAKEPSRLAREPSRTDEEHDNIEGEILHGTEPDAECPVSSSEDVRTSQTDINVIFDPKDPSNSRVEGRRKSSKAEEKMSRIRLNETVNLNLQTNQGQDLVISLTVRPRTEGSAHKLSITDIFSDSRTNVPERDRRGSQEPEKGPKDKGSKGNLQTRTKSDHAPSYEDVTIPLSRTKVCSSLEFDVQVVDSRMKSAGIKHTNPNIVVRLNDMGVNNLLRACRPVKCGRKAILNESGRKCLPYAPSLESLPLEEIDADIIDQSLDMSIKKSKHSTIFIKDNKLAYMVEMTGRRASATEPVKQVYFVQVFTPSAKKLYDALWVERVLGYYINIEEDLSSRNEFFIDVEVYYFEIENIRQRKDHTIPATIISVKLKNSSNSKDSAKKRHPSRIPVYKYRYPGCKKCDTVSDGVVDTKRENPISLKESLATSEPEPHQHRSKSVLTIRNDDEASGKPQYYSKETAEYFNRFMRYISLLNSSTSAARKMPRKKTEFYTSRSHSSLLITTKTVNECSERNNTKTEKKQQPAKPSCRDGPAAKGKGIKLNDVILSSTRFKKQLNFEKTTSRIVINRLSNFLYENIIKDLSPETRKEILKRIDRVLNVHSKINKNGTIRGSSRFIVHPLMQLLRLFAKRLQSGKHT